MRLLGRLAAIPGLTVAAVLVGLVVVIGGSADPAEAATGCPTLPATTTTGSSSTGGPATGSAAAPSMPYELPATSGKTGREEAVNEAGQVASTGGKVTWPRFAALGQPYRDFYITMRWNYTSWNWDGTSSGVDQAQYGWFAAQPRLVLVSNPRSGKSIVAAAIEAGPGPWVGVVTAAQRSIGNGPSHGWPNPTKGTPAGYTGIVSGFPPAALAALDAKTGYLGEDGDVLAYQWAPEQTATPGPTSLTAAGGQIGSCSTAMRNLSGGPVNVSGVTVTIPNVPDAGDHAGMAVQAPNAAVAAGIAKGLSYLGTPYVWGGGNETSNGPTDGCDRGGGTLNSCQGFIGFDCSGLTSNVITWAGSSAPAQSSAQASSAKAIAWSQAQPGDIVHYPGHVSVYLGLDSRGRPLQLEAPEVGKNVRVSLVRTNRSDSAVYRWWT